MDRILIIGPSGAGKSTLAKKLGEILHEEVTYLDKIYFKKGWELVSKDEYTKTMNQILSRDKWIIDANYPREKDERLEKANWVIFLNFNKYICLFRVIKRFFDRKQPFHKTEGNLNRLSWHLISKLLKYSPAEDLKKLEKYKSSKNIIVLSNQLEIETFLATLK